MARETAKTDGKNASKNGKVQLKSLADLDGRTNAARRVQTLVANIEQDLGGRDRLSTAQSQLAQRAALLSAVLEHQEAEWVSNGEIDLEDYTRALNSMARVLQILGVERRTRNATPSLGEYLDTKREGAAT